ncbi:unnamed protein product [Agarophyton chilense]
MLGWLETFIKIAAWIAVPHIRNRVPEQVPTLSPPALIQFTVMLVASTLLLLAIIDRLVYREIISMMFVFPNNWAHWTVTLALYQCGREGINTKYFRIFCWLMFTGDIVKLAFFAFHDFSRLGITIYVLVVLTALFTAMYGVILLLDYGYGSQLAVRTVKMLALESFLAKIQQ